MIIGKVVGTVVSSVINSGISGGKYLLVEKCNQKAETKGDFLVALDLVGCWHNEMVMISESTSARETATTTNKAIDAIIVGIIDLIDESDTIVYKK